MDVSCITTQQIVYYPVDVPSSVSISGSKSVLFWLSWADASRVQNSAQGRDVCEYSYPAGKLTIWARWAAQLLPVRVGGVSGRDGVSSRVGYLRRLVGGAPVPVHLHCVCRFFAVPLWQSRDPAVWFWGSIAKYLSILVFTFLCQGRSTPRFVSSWATVRGIIIRNCVSTTAPCENTPSAVFTIFKARRMLDGSSCTWPPCPAIVADMLKTSKKLVAACNDEIRQVPQPCTPP